MTVGEIDVSATCSGSYPRGKPKTVMTSIAGLSCTDTRLGWPLPLANTLRRFDIADKEPYIFSHLGLPIFSQSRVCSEDVAMKNYTFTC